jgi:hypothetical protein
VHEALSLETLNVLAGQLWHGSPDWPAGHGTAAEAVEDAAAVELLEECPVEELLEPFEEPPVEAFEEPPVDPVELLDEELRAPDELDEELPDEPPCEPAESAELPVESVPLDPPVESHPPVPPPVGALGGIQVKVPTSTVS